jgi:hypothetical protein
MAILNFGSINIEPHRVFLRLTETVGSANGDEFAFVCQHRHFGTMLGTWPAVPARVLSRSPFDPMMRTSPSSTSTRWAKARRWSRR